MQSTWTDPKFLMALGGLALGLACFAALACLLHLATDISQRRESPASRKARLTLDRFLETLRLIRHYLAENRRRV